MWQHLLVVRWGKGLGLTIIITVVILNSGGEDAAVIDQWDLDVLRRLGLNM